MRMIILQQDNIYSGDLILVNRQHPYRDKPVKKTLVPVDNKNPEVLLEYKTAGIFKRIMDELGVWEQIIAVSGWRSEHEQKQIYSKSLRENGSAFTKQYVALPNHSEHQTGMAIDLGLNQPNIDFIRPNFPYNGVCGALREMARLFGFVERYPKEKEYITGIAHEPWHFRYVGAPHSEIIEKDGRTLEEYHMLLKQYPYGKQPLVYGSRGRKVEISYLKAEADGMTLFEVDEAAPCLVSGNNMDGFIITVWRDRR